MNKKLTLVTGAAVGALAVILGASGAHALKPLLSSMGKVDTFELANRYHFYHALALLITGLLMPTSGSKGLIWSALFFFLGILLFSGSLYTMCFIKLPWLGPVTPLGGLCFIAGWLLLLITALKTKTS